ncbi:hypothetical protein [Anaerocellum diazotrophicum]|uniref:Uncharacterized protein n=1 Tax=Caldicellulosiruptor diazotrophicus TaxID=2806205 RepID=A0ABN6E6M2_9FIRM|nr:hypothetical protein [Caldicellulosiruptor diazotrophicus]BCS81040.1 hypothetical protein CaldiYA01_10000 [Caldicellulosiruptor diazotrophicus]
MIWILALYFLILLVFLPAYFWVKQKDIVCSLQHSLFLAISAMFDNVFLIAAGIWVVIILTVSLIGLIQTNRKQRGSLS